MSRLSDYDYDLPESAIAQRPLDDRSASRLLVLHKETGKIEHRVFRDVVDILLPGDLLVLNDTRVTAFRLFGQKPTGGKVEVLAIKQLSADTFECLLKPAKRLKVGTEIIFERGLMGTVIADSSPVTADRSPVSRIVRFAAEGDLAEAIAKVSTVPLPPYIHESLSNPERYQTVYASTPGSAAAPTAGLHFTPGLLASLENKGVRTAFVTLDVGIDTFRPVTSENPDHHPIHGETCTMPAATQQVIQGAEGRIIAVGTTSVRTLESFATGRRQVEAGSKQTRLFIKPGYEFKIVDGMFTNFHLPRTTMLMMISALAGRENVMRAYDEALKVDYRFLSFGDSMLIL